MPALSTMILLLGMSCRVVPRADSGTTDTVDTELTITGAQGSEGGLLWPTGVVSNGVVERSDDGGQSWQAVDDGDAPWLDSSPTEAGQYRLRINDDYGPAITLTSVSGELSLTRPDALFYNNDDVVLEWDAEGDAAGLTTQVQITRTIDDVVSWMSADCLETVGASCWSDKEVSFSFSDLPETFPTITAQTSEPTLSEVTIEIQVATSGDSYRSLHASTITYAELGREIAWGDIHAHSTLSNDGCEGGSGNDCQDRSPQGAAYDFFANAVDVGLDFAAITDHAEWTTYTPDIETTPTDIWQEQQSVARLIEVDLEEKKAKNGSTRPFVPIIGYEWTDFGNHNDGSTDGGHKTVLLDKIDACLDWRVGAALKDEPDIKPFDAGILEGGNTNVGVTPSSLWASLDAAAKSCEGPRALTFFHHSAFSTPQSVVWQGAGNTPDPVYESVVEIYSEHGCSECRYFDDPNCDWRGKTDGEYSSEGSVQNALSQGFLLGFVAGTDSHDGRPGSVDDGPSCTANTVEDEFICHDHSGGLTGVLYEDTLSRDAIFDAFESRNTFATSRPMMPVRAALIGEDGVVYLPGDAVPALEARTARLIVSVDGLLGEGEFSEYKDAAIEVLDPDNTVLAQSGVDILDTEIQVVGGEVFYIRLRLYNTSLDGERMWLSPFFGTSPEEKKEKKEE